MSSVSRLTRRQFIASLAATALGLALPKPVLARPLPPRARQADGLRWGRSLTPYLREFKRPDFNAEFDHFFHMDDVFPILGDVQGGALWGRPNRLWHRTEGGYVHSMNVQPIDWRLNPVIEEFDENGWLGEISVPYSDAIYYPADPYSHAFRLYHTSVYRVTGLVQGADGTPLYALYDERLGVHFYTPAVNVRRVAPEELTPINPNVRNKRVHIDVPSQRLVAYQGDTVVMDTLISGGLFRLQEDIDRDGGHRTLTPEGNFTVLRKMPSRHMGGGDIYGSDYELPGVPWVTYFAVGGYALHGAWWHSDWGYPHSHGCINMRSDEARWIYRWLHPPIDYSAELHDADPDDRHAVPIEVTGYGYFPKVSSD